MVNIEFLQRSYFANMKPVPYKLKKGGTLNIRPILTEDYYTYEWAIQILLIPKNEIGDINIIKMSYLQFIENEIFLKEGTEDYKNQLWWIIKLCLDEDIYTIKDGCLIICDESHSIKYIISPKEFDEISKIILHQNNYNYDDRYINPDVKELMEEMYKIKYKNAVSPSLEKRKAFVASKTGKSFEQMNKMPYREFELVYDACKDSEIYIGQKIIQGSYKYQCDDIKHPLFEPKRDIYEELFEDTSVLQNKGISGAEQLVGANLQELVQ